MSTFVLIVDHAYEDGAGAVRFRRFMSNARDEPAAMTCSKIAFATWVKDAILVQAGMTAVTPQLN